MFHGRGSWIPQIIQQCSSILIGCDMMWDKWKKADIEINTVCMLITIEYITAPNRIPTTITGEVAGPEENGM